MPKLPATNDTSRRILDIAERLLQTRGYNAFSYADIAQSLHVTKASLHYHFPTKAHLGQHLIERYKKSFMNELAEIERTSSDSRERLRRYTDLYAGVLRDGRMCLCGMLAAEYTTLPKSMKAELKSFFDDNEQWLTGVLEKGRREKELHFSGTPRETAVLLISSLEGAMMLARSYDDVARFQATAGWLLASLVAR